MSGDSSDWPAPRQVAAGRAPKFEFAADTLVLGSAWQSEVFLPCKILNLEEDQTVSMRLRVQLVAQHLGLRGPEVATQQ